MRLEELLEESRRQCSDLAETLKQSEARFQLAADAAPAMIWIADPSNQCTWFNRAWLSFTGRSLDLEVGDGWAARIHPDDLERALDAYTTHFGARQPFRIEYRLRRKDEVYRWILDDGAPAYDAAGAFVGYVNACTDITEQKTADAERESLLVAERAARTQAERISKLKDEFLSTLSHELRTPLNAILGWAQLLAAPDVSPEDIAEGLQTIARNARVQTQLIEDLVDMSRIISGRIRLDVQRVDLAAVVRAAAQSLQPAADAKKLRVQSILDPQAGPVSGDPARLQQVVWNILSNAIKFTPAGGRIGVTLERVNSRLEIAVNDTGQGIKPEFLPHVFDRFRQADRATTRHVAGLGIGLSIVKHLAELHGGSVRARSPGEGRGATFVVSLPLAVLHDEGGDRQHPRSSGLSPAPETQLPTLQGIKILVVDDEPDARDLLRHVLEYRKATVVVAGGAEQALNLLRQHRPDVLVSDIGMPEMDGYELIRLVRSLPPEQGGKTPAMALTAFARSEDRRRAMLAGFQIHMAKPVEPPELIATIANLSGRTGGAGRVGAPS